MPPKIPRSSGKKSRSLLRKKPRMMPKLLQTRSPRLSAEQRLLQLSRPDLLPRAAKMRVRRMRHPRGNVYVALSKKPT